MSHPAKTITRLVGCDVGKRHIVIFDKALAQSSTIDNTPMALQTFAQSLDPACLVVCEATGGYETALLEALSAANVPAHRADARKVKAFIRSFGTLGKTDTIDARALTVYGAERLNRLAHWRIPDPDRVRLQSLVLTRRDLVNDRTAYGNHLKAPTAGPSRIFLKKILTALQRQIKALDGEIQTLLDQGGEITQAQNALLDIPGIGPATAAALIALMPELGTLSRRQAAALAGLAPHPNDSGLSNGYRRTRGGRPEVKRTLFMAALSASKHNPKLKTFYDRLIKNGKKPIVALTAVMRKIIIIANAKLRDLKLKAHALCGNTI